MQKYLLLLLMCLVGMIEAQAGIKVENVGTGSYILTFTNSADATYDWNSLLNSQNSPLGNVSEVTSLKIVTDNYELTESDMINVMGNDNNNPFFTNLVTLDMGDSKLANYGYLRFMTSKKLSRLKSFTFPKTTPAIPEGMFAQNQVIEEIIMLEPDDPSDTHITSISKQAFQNCTKLSNVRLPYGVTSIAENAFEHCAFESISLPTSLTTIGTNAFGSCKNLKSVTIPESITSIGYGAFQKNTSMTDVYVLGSNVTIANGAFNQEETFNFKYQDNGDGKVEYSDWKSTSNNADASSPYPLRLHIPEDATAKYMNPYLRALNDPRITNEMLDNFDRYQNRIKEIISEYEGVEPNNGIWYYQRNEGKPCYVVMDGKRYFWNGNGKFNEENEGQSGACGPYAGWRNFMLIAGDVDEKIWHDGRLVESRWYSAVFPFDMSYNQVMSAYGAKTDVREFSYVNKKVTDGQETRTVTFSKRVTIPNGDKNNPKYVQKGVPYMIHPGVRSIPLQARGTAVQTSQERTIAGVDVKAANDVVNTEATLVVTGDLVDGNNPLRGSGYATITPDAYTFRGSYKDGDIPANSFYLGYDPDDPIKWPLAFYVTKKTLVGKWTAFTSIVQKVNADATSQAKTMSLGFSDDFVEDFGIATEIERVYTEKRSESNSVYNLNGQVVRENNTSVQGLSKGVYVVNGKKIVVR